MGDEIYKFLRRKLEVSQYLCKTYSPFVDFLIKELSLSFKQKNMNQLELLKVTGFCLSTTVKSPQKFGMCMGASSFGQNKYFYNDEVIFTKDRKMYKLKHCYIVCQGYISCIVC
jgi:hypothetical protein